MLVWTLPDWAGMPQARESRASEFGFASLRPRQPQALKRRIKFFGTKSKMLIIKHLLDFCFFTRLRCNADLGNVNFALLKRN